MSLYDRPFKYIYSRPANKVLCTERILFFSNTFFLSEPLSGPKSQTIEWPIVYSLRCRASSHRRTLHAIIYWTFCRSDSGWEYNAPADIAGKLFCTNRSPLGGESIDERETPSGEVEILITRLKGRSGKYTPKVRREFVGEIEQWRHRTRFLYFFFNFTSFHHYL